LIIVQREKELRLEARFQTENNDPEAPVPKDEKDFESRPIEKKTRIFRTGFCPIMARDSGRMKRKRKAVIVTALDYRAWRNGQRFARALL